MSTSKATIEKFKITYKKDFGVDLSDLDALEVMTKLVGLFELLSRFYLEDEAKTNGNS